MLLCENPIRGSWSIQTKNSFKAVFLSPYRFQVLYFAIFDALKSLYPLMDIGFKEILFYELTSQIA